MDDITYPPPSLPKTSKCRKRSHPILAQTDDTNAPRYHPCTIIGKGTYGHVFQYWDSRAGEHVAVKMIISPNGGAREIDLSPSIFREIAIMRRCNHPNITPALHTFYFSNEMRREKVSKGSAAYLGGFVMPLLTGGDLNVWSLRRGFNEKTPMPMRCVQSFARQLFSALQYLHERSIIHRDVKPDNCLVSADGETLVLSDFGIGRTCSVPLGPIYTGDCCTLWYRPPDLIFGSRTYGTEVDIWSAAATVADLVLGHPFVPGRCEIHQLYLIFEALGSPSPSTWPELVDYPRYRPELFPGWRGVGCSKLFERTSGDAKSVRTSKDCADFLSQTLVYRPCNRLSAKRSLKHKFLLAAAATRAFESCPRPNFTKRETAIRGTMQDLNSSEITTTTTTQHSYPVRRIIGGGRKK